MAYRWLTVFQDRTDLDRATYSFVPGLTLHLACCDELPFFIADYHSFTYIISAPFVLLIRENSTRQR